MSEAATTPPVWLTVEFRGFASSGQPLFSINGGQTQFRFTHDDLLEAFRGLLPTEDTALGRPVRIEPSVSVRRSAPSQDEAFFNQSEEYPWPASTPHGPDFRDRGSE